jgi:putative adenylate-forming enzyme
MNKDIMMTNFDVINTVGLKKDKALSFAMEAERTREFKDKLQGITVGLSSGTSNSRGIFIGSDEEKSLWAGYIIAKMLSEFVFKSCKIAFFMRANSELYEAVKGKNIQMKFFDIYKDMKENIDQMQGYQPNIIVGQPSVLMQLSKAAVNGELNVKADKVISVAEVLEEKDGEFIRKALKVPMVHQVYQCTEGCLAHTCAHGRLHLHEDIVKIEKEYLDEERFIPIITDFTRVSQPVIRYRLNDILVEDKNPCTCGNVSTVIKKIEGRQDDIFVFWDKNKTKEVLVFPDFIRRCILFAGEIMEYRILQKKDKDIIVYVDCSDALKAQISKEFLKLSQDQGFVLPKITYQAYSYNKDKKLKRIEVER